MLRENQRVDDLQGLRARESGIPEGWTQLLPGVRVEAGDRFRPIGAKPEDAWGAVLPDGIGAVVPVEGLTFIRAYPPDGYERALCDGSETIGRDWLVCPVSRQTIEWLQVPDDWAGTNTSTVLGKPWLLAKPVMAEVVQPPLNTDVTRPLIKGDVVRGSDETRLSETGEWQRIDALRVPDKYLGRTWAGHNPQADTPFRRPMSPARGVWYVAAHGVDKGAVGTKESPFRTLTGAQRNIEKAHTKAHRMPHGVICTLNGDVVYAYDLPEEMQVEVPQDLTEEFPPADTGRLPVEGGAAQITTSLSDVAGELAALKEIRAALDVIIERLEARQG